jgi:hypothetical protein
MLMKLESAGAALLYDPRGEVSKGDTPIAPRPAMLEGLRLGVLDNSKWNANKLLRGAAAAIGARVRLGVTNYYVKGSFSKDAAPELIERIATENDLVLTAIGDCGSCCSCCVRDSVALERLGVPAACIITTEFEEETRLTRRAIGMPGLVPVVIDHPVSSIAAEEMARRVAQVDAQAEAVWLGRAIP